jgi:hypothetical protein
MLDAVEIHKSVDLLADTCKIKLPATVNNKPVPQAKANELGDDIKGQLKRGDKVKVWLGYDVDDFSDKKPEFEGFLLNITTDDGSIEINCEDDLFLFRKAVKDKQFKSTGIKTIAEYLVTELQLNMKVNCSLTIEYDKFVIAKATGYDVLKKLQDETKGNIYIKTNEQGEAVLNIHPPFIEKHGYVDYSYQHNIEDGDLKYRTKEDRKVQVIIERTGRDGKTIKETFGTTGGEQETIKGDGMSKEAMLQTAQNRYNQRCYEGFEGSITTWLDPYVEPGYSASIEDEDYPFKNGSYYVTAVTTSMDGSGGGVRKVQLGIKLSGNG